ncbi:hypothetical protein BC629DRAFT_1598305 [Irpex lacteus]|nr:hypothetical protein BC629DRAFT_1598305 [Irpex lacteus]
MLVKPSTPPPEPLQPSRSTVLNTSEPVPPTPLVDSPQTSTTYNVPHVQLDADHISNAMAARLATSLLGHVLFLKSQIPFPVVQMARMGTMKSKSTSKAAKKRIELMAAIDTLSSHLETTFLALSSAFAQRVGAGKAGQPVTTREKEKAHMIFVVGPSVGAAKAKVALVFDGLEVKLAGERDDIAQVRESPPPSSSDTEGSAAVSDSSEEEDESTASEGSALEDSTSEDGRDSEQEEAPPPSPSPSPSPAPSRPSTPLSLSLPTRPSPSSFTIYSDPPPPSSSSSLPNPTPHQNQNQKPSPLKPLHGPTNPGPTSPSRLPPTPTNPTHPTNSKQQTASSLEP